MVSWTQTVSLCFVLLHACYVQYHGTRYFENYFGPRGLWPRAVQQLSDAQQWYRCTGSSTVSSPAFTEFNFVVRPLLAQILTEKELALLRSWNTMTSCLQSSLPSTNDAPLSTLPTATAAVAVPPLPASAKAVDDNRNDPRRPVGDDVVLSLSGGYRRPDAEWMLRWVGRVWDQSPRWMDWTQTWVMTRKFAYRHQRAFELKRLQFLHMFQEFSLEVEDFVAQTNWLAFQFLYLCSHLGYLLYCFEQESAAIPTIAAHRAPPLPTTTTTTTTTTTILPSTTLFSSSSSSSSSSSAALGKPSEVLLEDTSYPFLKFPGFGWDSHDTSSYNRYFV